MSKIVQGISVRDNYPDYPKELKDWQLWQVMENHEIGVRTALVKDKAMDHKFQIRSWHTTSKQAIENEGHSNLAPHQCSCYLKWIKARAGTLLPFAR